jgi:hypothetical protein
MGWAVMGIVVSESLGVVGGLSFGAGLPAFYLPFFCRVLGLVDMNTPVSNVSINHSFSLTITNDHGEPTIGYKCVLGFSALHVVHVLR